MLRSFFLLQTLLLSVVLPWGTCQSGEDTIVQCRATTDCTGNFSSMTKRQCCVESADGLAFTVNGEAYCHVCIVFGWFQESFIGMERGPGHTIQAGYRKGRESAARNLVFDVESIEGNAREGSGLDYTLGVTTIRALFEQSSADEVVVTFRVDSIALEPDEEFALELVPRPAITLPSGDGVFFINRINMTIIDSDNLNVFFTEDDYRAPESALSVPVRVTKDRRIATPITLQIHPVTVMRAEELGETMPEQMPDDDPFSPNRADLADFDDSTITMTFQSDEDVPVNELSVPVPIVDDDVNEATEQVFIVILKLVESTNQDRTSLESRNSSLCRIVDNDPIAIGFEQPRYMFTEPQFIEDFSDGPVFLVKDNNRTSEQTFQLVFQVSSSTPDSSIRSASLSERLPDGTSLDNDYILSTPGRTSEVASILPSQQRIPFKFTLFPDDLPEATEAFQVSFSPRENTPAFSIPLAEAFIIIEDDDDVVIGFERTSFTVNEGVGLQEVCVRVFNPIDDQPLSASIALTIQSAPRTATSDDFIELSAQALTAVVTFGNDQRRDCFNVEIINDSLVESTEDFNLGLTFIGQRSQLPGVVLQPNLATVVILDDDAVIGFINSPFSVSENDGNVVLQVGLIEGSLQEQVVVSLSTSDLTAFAGSDYEALTAIPLTFTPNTNTIDVPVAILDDSIFEPTERFTASLSLSTQVAGVSIAPAMAEVSILDEDVETPTGTPTTTVVVTVTVIICVLVIICIIVIIVIIIIVCLCCKKRRGFLILKGKQIHTDEESQQIQTPYTTVNTAQQQVNHSRTGLLSSASADNLSQDSL